MAKRSQKKKKEKVNKVDSKRKKSSNPMAIKVSPRRVIVPAKAQKSNFNSAVEIPNQSVLRSVGNLEREDMHDKSVIFFDCSFDQLERCSQHFQSLVTCLKSNFNGVYRFYYSFNVGDNNKICNKVLNREDTYKEIEQIFKNPKQGDHKNCLPAIASIPGGGKTTVLADLPHKITNPTKGKSFVPIFIAFNSTTQFDKNSDTNAKVALNRRIFRFFIRSLMGGSKDIERQDILLLIDDLEPKLFDFNVASMLTSIIRLIKTKQSFYDILLLVDEVAKVVDNEIRKEILTIVGNLFDNSQEKEGISVYPLVSTLDHFLFNTFTEHSSRRICYAYTRSLKDVLFPLSDPNFINITNSNVAVSLKNFKQRTITLIYQCSYLPRYLFRVLNYLDSDENQDVKEAKVYSFLSEMFISLSEFETLNQTDLESLLNQTLFYLINRSNTLEMNNYLEKTSGYKIGTCFKYGLLLNTNTYSKLVMNSLLIFRVIKNRFLLSIKSFMPIKELYDILEMNFPVALNPVNNTKEELKCNPDSDPNYTNFEWIMMKLDIMLRKYFHYSQCIFPFTPCQSSDGNSVAKCLSEIYGNRCKCLRLDTLKLSMKNNYQIVESSEVEYFRDLQICKEFFEGGLILKNSGCGYDWAIAESDLQANNYILFYEDKLHFTKSQSVFHQIIKEKVKHCKSSFDTISKKANMLNKKICGWILIIRCLAKLERNINEIVSCGNTAIPQQGKGRPVEPLDVKILGNGFVNLILVDEDAIADRFSGMLDLQFDLARKFHPTN